MLFHSSKKPVELKIICINETLEQRQSKFKEIIKNTDNKKSSSPFAKLCKLKKDKTKHQKDSSAQKSESRVFLLDFDGDIKASAVAHLREEISAIIAFAKAGDEVVLRLESSGGQVHGYGLAAAQLKRIKEAGLKLTICVDKVAASGGYMMACVGDKIIASDFAIIGSVGVVSQMPNFHDFLKKHDVNFEMFTAGEYKRTVTMFGENDDKDREKYQQELDRIHELFKEFIRSQRPSLDVERIATGEYWFGRDALDNGLIDEIGTSDAYILDATKNHQVFALVSKTRPTFAEKLGFAERMNASGMIDMVTQAVPEFLQNLKIMKS